MESTSIEKSKVHIPIEIIEYVPNAVVTKTILKKPTGNISIISVDSSEGLSEKTSPFDTFLQVIDGMANIVIGKRSFLLHTGQSIVIPAHMPNYIKSDVRFKLMFTVIKSGYE